MRGVGSENGLAKLFSTEAVSNTQYTEFTRSSCSKAVYLRAVRLQQHRVQRGVELHRRAARRGGPDGGPGHRGHLGRQGSTGAAVGIIQDCMRLLPPEAPYIKGALF